MGVVVGVVGTNVGLGVGRVGCMVGREGARVGAAVGMTVGAAVGDCIGMGTAVDLCFGSWFMFIWPASSSSTAAKMKTLGAAVGKFVVG